MAIERLYSDEELWRLAPIFIEATARSEDFPISFPPDAVVTEINGCLAFAIREPDEGEPEWYFCPRRAAFELLRECERRAVEVRDERIEGAEYEKEHRDFLFRLLAEESFESLLKVLPDHLRNGDEVRDLPRLALGKVEAIRDELNAQVNDEERELKFWLLYPTVLELYRFICRYFEAWDYDSERCQRVVREEQYIELSRDCSVSPEELFRRIYSRRTRKGETYPEYSPQGLALEHMRRELGIAKAGYETMRARFLKRLTSWEPPQLL